MKTTYITAIIGAALFGFGANTDAAHPGAGAKHAAAAAHHAASGAKSHAAKKHTKAKAARDGDKDDRAADSSGDRTPGARDPGVNARQERQKDRIGQGMKSGQLTKGETKELADTQKDIRQEEKEYKSDGALTKDERVDLHQDLNAASKQIYQEKHDAETQPGVTPAKPGQPGARDPGVNARQENQKDRIAQGVKSGELTKKETFTLAQKEAHLAKMERKMKEDGSLTAEERAKLQKQLNWLSADIYKQKHDEEQRSKTE